MTEPDLITFVNAQAQVYSRYPTDVSGSLDMVHLFRSLRAWDTALRRSVIPAVGIAIGTKIL